MVVVLGGGCEHEDRDRRDCQMIPGAMHSHTDQLTPTRYTAAILNFAKTGTRKVIARWRNNRGIATPKR
jgi:hypothetical protein